MDFRSKIRKVKYRKYERIIRFEKSTTFFKSIYHNGLKGFINSLFLILLIILFDYSWKILLYCLQNTSNDSAGFSLYGYLKPTLVLSDTTNDYLTNLVSIGAGVVGVILGLIYTAFVTILSTKYGNINSSITSMVMNHSIPNKYFNFLATLTSLSIIFQFMLSFGYEPTVVSTLFFSVLIIFAVTSFVTFAKFTQYLSDTKLLVDDLIGKNHEILNKFLLYKDLIEIDSMETNFLRRVFYNLGQIELIVKESINATNSSTSFEGIYYELDEFLLYYLQIKHSISSKEEWHVKVQRFKKWDDLSGHEARLFEQTGVEIPENVAGYNEIEKRIIEIQFLIFKHYINEPRKVHILQDKFKYIQVSAYQCEIELFDIFYENLEKLIIEKIQTNKENDLFCQYMTSMYPFFFSHHVVGFNNSVKIYSNEHVVKLSNAINSFGQTEKIFQFPYFLKRWMDSYSDGLVYEKQIESRLVTPVSYTQNLVALTVSYHTQEYVKNIIYRSRRRLISFITKLDQLGFGQEALHISIEIKEIAVKLNLMINYEDHLLNSIKNQAFSDSSRFDFKEKQSLENEVSTFEKDGINQIWRLGIAAYSKGETNAELPDLFGKFYYIVATDVFDLLLVAPLEEDFLIDRLKDFIRINYLFFSVVWERNKDKEEYSFASSVLPIIVDLLDILSTAIIIAKAQDKPKIIDAILEYYDNDRFTPETEIQLWQMPVAVLKLTESGIGLFSNRSYDTEHARETKLSAYLLEQRIITKDLNDDFIKSYREVYISNKDDIYLHVLASFFDRDRIEFMKIRDVFIEFFLRSRINLISLKIDETDYGNRLTRKLGD